MWRLGQIEDNRVCRFSTTAAPFLAPITLTLTSFSVLSRLGKLTPMHATIQPSGSANRGAEGHRVRLQILTFVSLSDLTFQWPFVNLQMASAPARRCTYMYSETRLQKARSPLAGLDNLISSPFASSEAPCRQLRGTFSEESLKSSSWDQS